MRRQIEPYLCQDLKEKMVLLSGPRQCGKTTLSKQLGLDFVYLNYDTLQDRRLLLQEEWDRSKPLWIFDEIHKMKKWKSWLKGIYDAEGKQSILVTGSARLDIYRKGGDSLAGRYLAHRLHPLTVAELKGQLPAEEVLERILRVGSFPEPFLRNDDSFARRWRRSHLDVIVREDLLDLEKVRDVKSIEILVDLLRTRVGSTISYSSLAEDLRVSAPTVKHWLQILENLYVVFSVRPYHRKIARSLLKEPKYYFYDTGVVAESAEGPGPVLENAVACALLREIQFFEDRTGKRGVLHYLRDKEKHEVDFLTVIDQKPHHMIEVKWSDDSFSPSLSYFQKQVSAKECVQLVHRLGQSRSKATGMRMEKAAAFLERISFESGVNPSTNL